MGNICTALVLTMVETCRQPAVPAAQGRGEGSSCPAADACARLSMMSNDLGTGECRHFLDAPSYGLAGS
ncbi:MAG: hypothetical protein OXD42_14100, partial [Rhodospirillaceae bacterium]|nr:hypothetical protein [Rhodospirillaceae bacterium]